MANSQRTVFTRQRARALLGETLIGELSLGEKLVEKGFDRLGRFGMRRELAGQLGARMLAPDEKPERPRFQLRGRVRRVFHLLFCPLSGGKLLDLLVFGRFGRGDRARRADAGLGADLGFDLAGERRVLLEEVARVVLALAEAVAIVDVPGARLLEHAEVDADLEHLAFARDALAEHDAEFGL